MTDRRRRPQERSEVLVSVIVLLIVGSPILIMVGWAIRGWAIAQGLVR